MTIPYKCEECGASLNIKDELAGTKGRCPKCKASFVVPAAPKPEAATEAEEPLEPAAVSAKSEFDSSDELTATSAAGGLSDDDIEKLLEGGGEKSSEEYGVAGKEEDEEEPSEKKSAERKITAQPVDEPDDDDEPMIAIRKRRRDDDGDEEEDDHDDDELMHRKKRGRERTPAPPTAAASAGVARELMGRGEKGKEKKDRDEKRSTRPFGGRDREGEEEGFSKQEIAGQLLKLGGPVVALLLILFLGMTWYLKSWSRGELPELASVTGRVTLNGRPLPNALVQFHPQSEANQTKLKKVSSSNAYTDAQGNYELLYISDVPGAVLGKHRVQIDASDENGMPITFSEEKQLAAEVASGSNTKDFPLTSASPKK